MTDRWFEIIGGILVALFAWLGKRLHDRVDAHDRTMVTREELDKTITRMHVENRENLEYIRERVDTIADRQSLR